MSTLDFTFSIPMTLPAPPLEATGFDAVAQKAARVARLPEEDVLVQVSPSARARADRMPLFADDDAGPTETDSEQREAAGPVERRRKSLGALRDRSLGGEKRIKSSGEQRQKNGQNVPTTSQAGTGLSSLAERITARLEGDRSDGPISERPVETASADAEPASRASVGAAAPSP
jgi:hypothetical protein